MPTRTASGGSITARYAWIFDDNRDERWDVSYWDTDFDGKPDLIGYHPDGRRHPTKVEKYQPKP